MFFQILTCPEHEPQAHSQNGHPRDCSHSASELRDDAVARVSGIPTCFFSPVLRLLHFSFMFRHYPPPSSQQHPTQVPQPLALPRPSAIHTSTPTTTTAITTAQTFLFKPCPAALGFRTTISRAESRRARQGRGRGQGRDHTTTRRSIKGKRPGGRTTGEPWSSRLLNFFVVKRSSCSSCRT